MNNLPLSFETNIVLDLPLYVLKNMYEYFSAIYRQEYNLHFQPFIDDWCMDVEKSSQPKIMPNLWNVTHKTVYTRYLSRI